MSSLHLLEYPSPSIGWRPIKCLPPAECPTSRLPPGGPRRFSPGGFFALAPDATAPRATATARQTSTNSPPPPPPPLLRLRRERCQTDRTTKLLGRVKVPRGARRVGIKKGRERCKKESGLDHPPLHHLALTQSLFFGEHQPASPPSAKPPPNIAPMSLNPQVARPMICWTYNSLDLRVAGP